jgi:hypothetical protein
MVFGMEPAAVGVSAATEAGLAAESAGVASGVAGALVPPPMRPSGGCIRGRSPRRCWMRWPLRRCGRRRPVCSGTGGWVYGCASVAGD